MALPKHKTSKQKKRSRRSHHALAKPCLVACPNCNQPKTPHRVCANCGFYRDEKKLEVEGF